MHILYLHQYFVTRKGTSGTRSYEFSRHLVNQGHEVTMMISGLHNKEFPVPPGEDYVEVMCDGIRVIAVAAGYNDPCKGTGMGGLRRMIEFGWFTRKVVKVGRKLLRPDIVFATHTPLHIGLGGMKLGQHFDVPFVFEVRDLWPELLINTEAVKNPVGLWYLRQMARKIYRACDHIIALSPGMKEGILRYGIADHDVSVITNASDIDLFRPDLDGSAARERLGLGDRFAAVYFGAMGHNNGLEYAIEAARILKERKRDDIVIVLHGAGGKREELQTLAAQHALDNVVFSQLVLDKTEVAQIVAGCDACMTIYRSVKEQAWSPNKMFDALAAGRPVIINVPGWLGETIEGNGCGRYADPSRPDALADALEELADNPDLCEQMGRNSRALAEREFERTKLADKLETILHNVVTTGKHNAAEA
jgi:glycosyltransferase involved in cell wall biosynthesis